MNSQEEVLSFMDMLDLDEEIIDSRLKSIMIRSNHSKKQLCNATQLLKYKLLINTQEDTECNNENEYDFVVNLIRNIIPDYIENVCEILKIVLVLNPTTLEGKAEHLIQQVIIKLSLAENSREGYDAEHAICILKICDSIMDAVLQANKKITLLFLDVPFEDILVNQNEKYKMHFLTQTIPKLFEGIVGFNILDGLWLHVKQWSDHRKENALKVLTCLSDYYLPIGDTKQVAIFESEILNHCEFWSIILYGLKSFDAIKRKVSVYLAKRAIDSLIKTKKNTVIKAKNLVFVWEHDKSILLKSIWNNFFVLLDSLEEKQGNIVIPSLKLFNSIKDIGDCWLNCAFNIGLKHDNTHVRLKCIEHRLLMEFCNDSEATLLIEALNDINIYEHSKDYGLIKERLKTALENTNTLMLILKAIPLINWSPVPFYHITGVLSELNLALNPSTGVDMSKTIKNILGVPCNNKLLRNAVHTNMSYFAGNCCKNYDWKSHELVYSSLQFQALKENNPFILLIKNLSVNSDNKAAFYEYLTIAHTCIDFVLLYLSKHEEDLNMYINIINEKIRNVQIVLSRQYADKIECYKDILYIVSLFNKTKSKDDNVKNCLNIMIDRDIKVVIKYISDLLSHNTDIGLDKTSLLFIEINELVQEINAETEILQIYATAVQVLLSKETELHKTVMSMILVNNLTRNRVLLTSEYKMIGLNDVLKLANKFEGRDLKNTDSVGKLRNVYFEKNCETVCMLLEQNNVYENVEDIVNYIEYVIECGGYGCLKWILRIVNLIINSLIDNETIQFDIIMFLNRMWNEIEELKSNNQYTPCIEEFVQLITQNVLLSKAVYNNIVICFSKKIIEYGPVKNVPLYYLITALSKKDIKVFGQLVYVLAEILLYCPVPRKDQRISDNLAIEILHNEKYPVKTDVVHFSYEIYYLAASTLCRIDHAETLSVIISIISKQIEDVFKNKQRYHSNSQPHRMLQMVLQHFLTVPLLKFNFVDLERIKDWSLEIFGKLPHQPSVRVCLEWFISLYYYITKTPINSELLETLKAKFVPITSQFIIIYWILKRKISQGIHTQAEYEFVMDTLLSCTMGQMFNIRLHSQYLATKLHDVNKNTTKYDYTISIIKRTFRESDKDKNFVKLKEDYFVNNFDIVQNVRPYFIYYILPKLCDVTNINEAVDTHFVKDITKIIDEAICEQDTNDFKIEWESCKVDGYFDDIAFSRDDDNKCVEDEDFMGSIQKKYIPWKNMSDINVGNVEKKRENPSELIVVASLIDKLPNLGGMARTSEVFGVKTYVVDSLRHLQDKQFQGLSVSAERWVDIEEIRPGPPLKQYLIKKKAEGYSVIAAEQTSTSCKLQTFKFPKKTLLLLGHEKEGVPCDLLPMMDHCVEIPQQGFVRSLNVHVTAAIFIWEYARQNIL